MIDLTALNIRSAVPCLMDWGGEIVPPFGGVTQRLDRLGSRHSIEIIVPPMEIEPDGRRWVSRLKRAKRLGGFVAFPQEDLDIGAPGAPRVASAVAGGTSLPLKGLTPGYVVREGQWLSVTHGGRSYLYSSDANVVANGAGLATLTVTPMLRSQLSVDDVVNLAAPVIEGWLGGDALSWNLDAYSIVGLQLTLTERA